MANELGAAMLERIKFLCARRHMTVGELEKTMRFSVGSIYKWSANSPAMGKVAAVARHFDVSLDWLVFGEEDKTLDPDTQALVKVIVNMTPEERSDMMTMLRIGFRSAFHPHE